jgi:hypothetical protein
MEGAHHFMLAMALVHATAEGEEEEEEAACVVVTAVQ